LEIIRLFDGAKTAGPGQEQTAAEGRKSGLFDRLKQAVSRTRESHGCGSLVLYGSHNWQQIRCPLAGLLFAALSASAQGVLWGLRS
jgi:hypothetical protein